MQAGLKLALGYDVPLSKTLALRPELTGLLGLNSPVQGVTWSPNEVRFGLSIVFTQIPEQSTPLQPRPRVGAKQRLESAPKSCGAAMN